MNLSNFEELIEAQIVERGHHYYQHQFVSRVERIGEFEFSAQVLGSEVYTVYLQLDEDMNIKEHSCTCPYDWGSYCKHKVATLYYIRDHKAYKQEINEQGAIPRIKAEIEQYSLEELKELVVDMSKKNGIFRNEILWQLGLEIDDLWEEV